MSIFVGNWKMNLGPSEAQSYCRSFVNSYRPAPAELKLTLPGRTIIPDTWIAPPLCSLTAVREALREAASLSGTSTSDTCGAGTLCSVVVGAQNVHWLSSGAHTGEISAPMLRELGAEFAIIGHSERRQHYGENDERVSMKAKAAIEHELVAIVCVGEQLTDFKAGKSVPVVQTQLQGSLNGLDAKHTKQLVIAYEPVWAIGTGLAATPESAGEMHLKIRELLREMFGETGSDVPIIYGGSATADNIFSLVAQQEISGALPGGASLKVESFLPLIQNGRKAKG